jgi:putative peptidoglycan lipid II flippase
MVGLVRERVFAHYFGTSAAADAFRAAFRIPNFLQNLFGEGVLSASFIPVYARLRAEGRDEEASKLAEAIFALLFLVTSVLVLAGIFAAPWLIDAIAPGFQGETRLLTIHLVQILFPGAALLVFSAWCLGILNSHRKFFLSYAAPVVWNLAIIATLLWKGSHQNEAQLAVATAIGSVIGSGLQFIVQLPTVMRFLWPLRLHLQFGSDQVRAVVHSFTPVFISRGVVQISAYVDSMLASFLPESAVAILGYAQTLSLLPVSLFGMAISAAELPAMSSELGTQEEIHMALRQRLSAGLQNIAFFVVPSAIAFIVLGDMIVSTIYRSGRFQGEAVVIVWRVLAGSGVGLLASTSGRLYSSAFYALRNTRTPLNFALVLLGIDRLWGVAGLTLSAGIAGWVEFTLLRRALHSRIGVVPFSAKRLAKLWLAAILASIIAYGVKHVFPVRYPLVLGPGVLAVFAVCYLGFVMMMGVALPGRFKRLFRR